MTILEKQIANHDGERCQWLTTDDYFHMCNCYLAETRLYTLRDRFEQLGLKHPEFAWEFGGDWCDNPVDCPRFMKFTRNFADIPSVKEDNKDGEDNEDEIEYSPEEKAAKKIAENEFEDDNYVKNLYNELKLKYIDRKKSEIEKQISDLKKIDEEIERI